MSVINYTNLMVIECDYPECGTTILVEDIAPGNYWPDEKVLQVKGWSFINLPIIPSWIALCPACKDKELPADKERKFHECIYIPYTKKGKPSEYGSIRRCAICDGLPI